jgi:hypothetical protein
MNYSYYLTGFAKSLNCYYNINKQDVLDHPENYLGPNYKELLNYWFYRESWGIEQREVYYNRWYELSVENRNKAAEIAIKLASEVIDHRFVVQRFTYEELEIFSAHLYLERGIPFTFLPLLFDL